MTAKETLDEMERQMGIEGERLRAALADLAHRTSLAWESFRCVVAVTNAPTPQRSTRNRAQRRSERRARQRGGMR